jgi:hypothetical protein
MYGMVCHDNGLDVTECRGEDDAYPIHVLVELVDLVDVVEEAGVMVGRFEGGLLSLRAR